MFSPDQWAASTGVAFYNGVATQSLRFDDGSSAYLNRTPSSAGNRKTWTWSSWIKRSNLGANSIFEAGTASNNSLGLQFDSASQSLQFFVYNGSSVTVDVKTTQVFRDVSAWYHIVMGFDTTQATASNRVKLYVNGSQITDLATSTYPSQNTDFNINNTNTHQIGRSVFGGSNHFDGYMAEVNFVDGQALEPTYFGELKNGTWLPIDTSSLTFGTNGFRLQFKQTGTGSASSSTIGADTSGNDNHFDSSGIVADDCNRTDSPENNHATLNPLQAVVNDNSTKPTLSDGNLVISTSTADYQGFSSTMAIPTEGKYAFKVKMNTESSTQTHRFGVGTSVSGNGIATDLAGNASGWHNAYVFVATVPRFDKNLDGAGQVNGTTLSPATVADDEIEFLVDMDNGTIDTKLNGSSYGTKLTGMPTDKPLFPFATVYESSSGTTTLTFTFDYTPSDSNYLTLCSANLPEPTISPNADTQADSYSNTVLYSGTGSAQSITGVGFQPDWVWVKKRNTPVRNHTLTDSSRGATKGLFSSLNDAEATNAQGLTSFDSDGFSVGTYNNFNESSGTYVAWNWKANGGTTSSNTNGSITSTVQANTTAGFSIVTYTGTGSGATIGHGVGKELDFIIIKRRSDSATWAVYSRELGSGKKLELNGTSGTITNAQFFTANPTSSVFSLGTEYDVNGSGGTFVAYCFAEIEGYSRMGSYIGSGSTDGPFVYLGFRPAWVMLKRTDSANNWHMNDSVRDIDNTVIEYLYADSSAVEGNLSGGGGLDFLSNGFKIRSTTAGVVNANGGKYIYMAFAENPFKYANAR